MGLTSGQHGINPGPTYGRRFRQGWVVEPRGVEPLTFALRIPSTNLPSRSLEAYSTVFTTCYTDPVVPGYAGTFPQIPCTITQELHMPAIHLGNGGSMGTGGRDDL